MIDAKIISFLKVYETGNFTKAAELLDITQPAVSKHISMLEEELGVKLFARAHNRLYTTSEGRIAAKYAKKMVSLHESMKKEISIRRNLPSSVSIGMTYEARQDGGDKMLEHYEITHEDLEISLFTDSDENLENMLNDGTIDIAVTYSSECPEGMRIIMLDRSTESMHMMTRDDFSHTDVLRDLIDSFSETRRARRKRK